MKKNILTIAVLLLSINLFSNNYTPIKDPLKLNESTVNVDNKVILAEEKYVNDIPFDTRNVFIFYYIKNILNFFNKGENFDYLKFDVNEYVKNDSNDIELDHSYLKFDVNKYTKENLNTVEEDLKELENK